MKGIRDRWRSLEICHFVAFIFIIAIIYVESSSSQSNNYLVISFTCIIFSIIFFLACLQLISSLFLSRKIDDISRKYLARLPPRLDLLSKTRVHNYRWTQNVIHYISIYLHFLWHCLHSFLFTNIEHSVLHSYTFTT